MGGFISPDKPVPVSPTSQLHFKQKTWTNSSFHKSKPAVGTQTKLELFFEAWLAYLGMHCHYLAGFVALLLRDSSAAAPDVSEKVVTTTLFPERIHNSRFPFPMQEWSCVNWRQQVPTGSGAAWHTWDTHSSYDINQLQGSPPSFQTVTVLFNKHTGPTLKKKINLLANFGPGLPSYSTDAQNTYKEQEIEKEEEVLGDF